MCHVPCESQKPEEKNVYIVIKVPPTQNEDLSFCGENSSFCGGVGACAASFFEQRL